MDDTGMKNTISGPERHLKHGERLLRISDNVRIKKFTFTAYITDQRVFLIDKNEKKPGVTSKEIPRDVIISSILESADRDPFLVLNIRTSADESRTMKIAFIEEENDRTCEIEEWINILHGRPLRTVKPASRQREPPAPVQKSTPVKVTVPKKPLLLKSRWRIKRRSRQWCRGMSTKPESSPKYRPKNMGHNRITRNRNLEIFSSVTIAGRRFLRGQISVLIAVQNYTGRGHRRSPA